MPHPFIPAPDTAKVQVVFNDHNGIVENVYHVLSSGGAWGGGALRSLPMLFDTWLRDHWASVADTGVEVVRIVATAIHEANGAVEEVVPATVIHGDVNAGYYMRSSTVAMSWRTGFAGRSNRGRTFHVGLYPGLVDSGNANMLSAGGRAALLTVYERLRTDLESFAGPGGLAIVSYMENGVWRTTAQVRLVTNVVTDFRVDTLRRRMNARPT